MMEDGKIENQEGDSSGDEHSPKKVRISPMFSTSESISDLISEGLKRGLELAEQIIKTTKFTEYLIEMSNKDINEEQLRIFIRDNTFQILPILDRGSFNAYSCVQREELTHSILINPILLLQLKLSECKEKHGSSSSCSTTDTPKTDPEVGSISQMQKNSFFVAVKICHEFSHLANFACGTRFHHLAPTSTEVETNPPPKMIRGVKFTDFGDMMEKMVFGCIIRLHHPVEYFGVQELIAILKPNHTSGYQIRLTQQNFIVDEQLLNLQVTIRMEALDDLDGLFPLPKKVRASTQRLNFEDHKDDDDDDVHDENEEEEKEEREEGQEEEKEEGAYAKTMRLIKNGSIRF